MKLKESIKGELHARNRHRGSYDFDALIAAHKPLAPFVAPNKYGTRSINFFDPEAVKQLNAALLKLHYAIQWWEIPPLTLTPPIPGRADYIHYVADLIGARGDVRCLDVGVGASCIYPIIGAAEYGWEFVGSDIDSLSLSSAQRIIEHNEQLKGKVELRQQRDPLKIFEGVILKGEHFDLTICNPPFHDSQLSAERGTQRKLRALAGKQQGKGSSKNKEVVLNFAGRDNELWCEGGEREFLKRMIAESSRFASQCGWFTSLVSKEDNLPALGSALKKYSVKESRVIEMSQGNKRSRVLAWRY